MECKKNIENMAWYWEYVIIGIFYACVSWMALCQDSRLFEKNVLRTTKNFGMTEKSGSKTFTTARPGKIMF